MGCVEVGSDCLDKKEAAIYVCLSHTFGCYIFTKFVSDLVELILPIFTTSLQG